MGGIGRNQIKAARRIFKLARVGYLAVYPETSLPGSDIYSLKKRNVDAPSAGKFHAREAKFQTGGIDFL